MTAELFDPTSITVDSPRLLWLKHHNLSLGQLPDGTRFCAACDRITTADTHKDCELLMATELEVEHWEVEEARKAGVVLKGDVVEECWE